MAWHAAAGASYLVLTVALTWPLALRLGALVPHDLGDTLLSTAILWWNARVLPFTDRWWDGFFFYPAPDTLTFSDHRVGLSLIATPALWLGASPMAAHNLAFLATYWLSAIAAYAFCFAITRSRAAAFVGGLIFGFNPFRAEHLPHLELLGSYWLPVAFVSLHRWLHTRRAVWLVVLAASLTLQAVTSGYYFFFAGVLIGLWLLWFLPRRVTEWRALAALGLALATPLALIAPVLLVYRAAHTRMALSRSIQEIELYSADLRGLVTPPEPLWLFDTPESWLLPEGAIFTGATAVLLVAAALLLRRTPAPPTFPRWLVTTRRLLLAGVIVMTLIALVPVAYGPVAFELAFVRVSISAAYKPLSVAIIFITLWVMTTAGVRDAMRRQSTFAFYVIATLAMWAFALGPTARVLGERFFYKAPYAWLMLLPGFADAFRVPARFAMLGALTLSAAAALAFTRLVARAPVRVQSGAVVLVSAAILLESWMAPFPAVRTPGALEMPAQVPQDAAVLELPMGPFEDALAMYHVTAHERPTLNGLSGYAPPHYIVLLAAIGDKYMEALSPLAAERDLAVFVDKNSSAAELLPSLEMRAGARRIATTSTHQVLLVPRAAPDTLPQAAPDGPALEIQALASNRYPENLWRMIDDDRVTAWSSEEPQKGGEEVSIDLGEMAEVDGVTLELGAHPSGFPRMLAIEASPDGHAWTEVWRGGTAAEAVSAALRDPRDIPIWFDLHDVRARHLRLKQLAGSESGWVIAELEVVGRLVEDGR